MTHQPSTLRSALTAYERELLLDAFDRAGNVVTAAQLLGVAPMHVYRLLKRHGLAVSSYVRGSRRTLVPA